MFHEVRILKIKRRSTRKMLTGEMFCGVCLYTYDYLIMLSVAETT